MNHFLVYIWGLQPLLPAVAVISLLGFLSLAFSLAEINDWDFNIQGLKIIYFIVILSIIVLLVFMFAPDQETMCGMGHKIYCTSPKIFKGIQ